MDHPLTAAWVVLGVSSFGGTTPGDDTAPAVVASRRLGDDGTPPRARMVAEMGDKMDGGTRGFDSTVVGEEALMVVVVVVVVMVVGGAMVPLVDVAG